MPFGGRPEAETEEFVHVVSHGTSVIRLVFKPAVLLSERMESHKEIDCKTVEKECVQKDIYLIIIILFYRLIVLVGIIARLVEPVVLK